METTQNAVVTAHVELTSPKLVELKNAAKVAWKAMQSMEDPFAPETKTAKLAFYKAESEVKAEESALQKSANDAKIAEMRNKRLALNSSQIDALTVLIALRNDKKADPAKLSEAETVFNTAKEAVDNELLAKYAASKSAKVATPSENGTDDKTSGGDNKAAILELARAGKTHKEIEEAGYKRSTVWHAINNAKKAGETFPNA